MKKMIGFSFYFLQGAKVDTNGDSKHPNSKPSKIFENKSTSTLASSGGKTQQKKVY